ncbi:MAG TPA: HupE/UreJ family protein [Lacipirellulaceae bacterium]|jgi:urease accessory protein
MKTAPSFSSLFIVPLAILGWPTLAHAHVGIGEPSGLLSGLTHPLTGLDHLCAMVGVGLWAAQRGGRAVWLVPLAFVTVMALGGLLGVAAVSIPFVESGIVASVLILGILIAAAVRLPLLLSILLVGTFALFHGHAHGAEMAHTYSALAYGLGFVLTTATLHLIGISIGLLAQKSGTMWLARYAGAAIAVCGLYLCL